MEKAFGQTAEGQRSLARARDVFDDDAPEDNPERINVRLNLGGLEFAEENYADAERSFGSALEPEQKYPNPDTYRRSKAWRGSERSTGRKPDTMRPSGFRWKRSNLRRRSAGKEIAAGAETDATRYDLTTGKSLRGRGDRSFKSVKPGRVGSRQGDRAERSGIDLQQVGTTRSGRAAVEGSPRYPVTSAACKERI